MLIQRIAGLVGAVLMGIGVFLPLVSIPIMHDDSYYDISRSGAIIMLVLSGLTILISIWGRFRLMYVTGLVAVGLMVLTYVKIDQRKTAAQSELKQRVIDMPLKNLSHNLISSVGLKYGWPMMMVGAAIAVAVPLVGSRLKRKEKD